MVLHASRRVRGRDPLRGVALLALVVLLTALTAPFVAYLLTSSKVRAGTSLGHLQVSQTANATDKSNLKLEQVDYSTPGAIAINLPTRLDDLLVWLYPWQIGNASQQLGLLGTVIVYPTLIWMVVLLYRSRGRIWACAGPLIYLAAFVLGGYSLSVGNAGTGFRYRTHVVAFGLAMIVVLRQRLLDEAVALVAERAPTARVATRPAPVTG